MKKLAIIYLQGLDSFLKWSTRLGPDYEVRLFAVTTQEEINSAIAWGDVIFFEWANEAAIYGLEHLLYQPKKSIVLRLHSYEALSGYVPQIAWRNVDRTIFVADHVRQICHSQADITPMGDNTVIIPNGVDVDTIPALNPGPGFEIASVGGISNKKNPSLMLQIIRKLVDIDKRYRLHVAGEFQELRYEIYLKYMVDEMGLKDNVIFYGYVSDMDTFWPGKNYLLHTSVHEGHCVSIIEAMARGIRPVIHNFYGARGQYPESLLYETIDTAVNMIQDVGQKNFYRQYVIDHNWTLTAQAAAIRNELDKLTGAK